MGGVTVKLNIHRVDVYLQSELDRRSNTLIFNKINSSFIFHHITKNILKLLYWDSTGNKQQPPQSSVGSDKNNL